MIKASLYFPDFYFTFIWKGCCQILPDDSSAIAYEIVDNKIEHV